MKRSISLFALCSVLLFGQTLPQIITAFKNREYKYVCEESLRNFQVIKKDENLISMYAYACLQSDMIDRVAVPLIYLKKSKRARKNRTYFSIVLMEKNLLVASLCDGMEYDKVQIPLADFYISKIVDLLGKRKFIKTDNKYIFFQQDISQPLYTITPKYNENGECYLHIFDNITKKVHIVQ